MKTHAGLALVALLLGFPAAHAQQVIAASSAPPPPRPGTALPPPGINDPGPQSIPLPSTGIPPSVAPAAREAEGHGDSTNVASRTDAEGDKIEEYSRGGKVYRARITPRHGIPQTYVDSSPNGDLVHDPSLGAVSPVYYTLYKWGGARKPPKGSDAETAPALPPPPASSSQPQGH